MNNHFIKLSNGNYIIAKDNGQLNLIEKDNIEIEKLKIIEKLKNAEEDKEELNSQLKKLQNKEKSRKKVNKITDFISLILAMCILIISKDLITTIILDTIILLSLRNISNLILGSKRENRNYIEDLLYDINMDSEEIDKLSKELNILNMLKIKTSKSITLKPIQESIQTYTKIKKKKKKQNKI